MKRLRYAAAILAAAIAAALAGPAIGHADDKYHPIDFRQPS